MTELYDTIIIDSRYTWQSELYNLVEHKIYHQ